MAGTSMKDIKLRIRSVESTMQITKAMQLVASSKLRQARLRMEASRPYLNIAPRVLMDIAAHNTGDISVYMQKKEVKRRCYVVIAGDRGLAGSYNANVFKTVEKHCADSDYCVVAIGRKAVEFFDRRNVEVVGKADKAEGISEADCAPIARLLLEKFKAGEFDEVMLAYTSFLSVLTQNTAVERILPVLPEEKSKKTVQMICEPGAEALLEKFMPQYLAGMIYAATCDSVASEQAARRVAMDSATKNAGQMIDDLSLRYNRARQGSITQELTEIVAGAEH